MQSAIPSALHKDSRRLSMFGTAKYIYRTDGILAFFRGVTPRMSLAASVTTFMVAGGDWMKSALSKPI